MSRLILDAGAFLALERGDAAMWSRLRGARMDGLAPRTHGGIVGQVWRGRCARQALLARALPALEVRALDAVRGRRAGELLAASRGDDVLDAALVLLASEGDRIVTSDVEDILVLVEARGIDIEVIRC
ncbi:MAG: hypothetical protein OHK0013_11990 [Sandaracinaceae bacterium]